MRVPVAPHPCQHLVSPVSQIWAILIGVWWYPIVYYKISLQFCNDIWCWPYFHVVIFHLCIFSETSVKVFCLFLNSVQFSRSVVSNPSQPHESQHARPPCPSPTPEVHLDSRPSSQWCHPAISSLVVPFLYTHKRREEKVRCPLKNKSYTDTDMYRERYIYRGICTCKVLNLSAHLLFQNNKIFVKYLQGTFRIYTTT